MSNPHVPKRLLTGAQLEEEDELVVLPQVDNAALIERYNLSLVGRLFHRDGRSLETIITALTGEKIWNVAGRVRGIPLGNSRFQIDFDSERDLLKVLKRRPCHFSKWSFALERWEPHVGDVFPNTMTFWVSTEGIPSQFWLEETFQDFGKALGVVRDVDAPMAKFQVTIKADEPLRFRKKTQLPSGEVVWVSLRYEKLFRWCKICHRICHEEDLCPLNPKTQAKLSMLVSGLSSSLDKQPESVPTNQANPPLAPPLNGKGNSHPSWWRPDLAKSPTEAEKSREDYRRRKAEGKRVSGNSSSTVWERLEKRQSGQWESSSRARFPDSRSHRGYAKDPPRHKERKPEDRIEDPHVRSKGTYQRYHKTQAPATNLVVNKSQELGRKRRSDEPLVSKYRKLPSIKENISAQPQRSNKMMHESSKPPIPPQVSDSQATLSDPRVTSLRAKQDLQSPDHTRARPFRLNLRKRSESSSLGNQIRGDSSDTGSSAKKSLNFDALEGEDFVAETQQHQRQSPVKKSWYEQTLEDDEEDEAANENPAILPVPQISNAVPSGKNIDCNPENSDEAVRIPETDEIDEEGDDEVNQKELEELENDWARKKIERGCENLNWTEEDEVALQQDEFSPLNTGDFMDEDDLLGEEIDEIEDTQSEIQSPAKKKISRGEDNGPTKRMGQGRPKSKGKKFDVSKKVFPPKGKSGQVEGHTAASKRLLNHQKRFSPKRLNTKSASARPNLRGSKPTALGPGTSVYPSSSKIKTIPPFDSTGGPKKPPGTTK